MLKNKQFFDGSLPAGFDGLFEWTALSNQAFPKYSNEDFMDVDAVMEKNGRFLHFETKSAFSKIPMGQQITINAYHQLGCITYIFLLFETDEKNLNKIAGIGVMYPNDNRRKTFEIKHLDYVQRFNLLVKLVKQWRYDAENGGNLTIKPQPIKEVIVEKEVYVNIFTLIKRLFVKYYKKL